MLLCAARYRTRRPTATAAPQGDDRSISRLLAHRRPRHFLEAAGACEREARWLQQRMSLWIDVADDCISSSSSSSSGRKLVRRSLAAAAAATTTRARSHRFPNAHLRAVLRTCHQMATTRRPRRSDETRARGDNVLSMVLVVGWRDVRFLEPFAVPNEDLSEEIDHCVTQPLVVYQQRERRDC